MNGRAITIGQVRYDTIGHTVDVAVDATTGVIELSVLNVAARLSNAEVAAVIRLLNAACEASPALVSAHHAYHDAKDQAALDLEAAIKAVIGERSLNAASSAVAGDATRDDAQLSTSEWLRQS